MTKTAEERAREIVDRGPLVTLSVAERYIELIASALRQTERAVWLSAAEVAEKSEYTITGNMIGAELRRRAEEV